MDAAEDAELIRDSSREHVHANTLLKRLALLYDEASTTIDVFKVVTEVNDWLSIHSNWADPNSVSLLIPLSFLNVDPSSRKLRISPCV